ncbi:hypothetical protein ACFOU2_17740 [Bacillus songklensis]|uniref:Uncharacterized protein n=1 Tax=Bacillus songklensis TaxID=1069116 RepID=A0ABV8B4G2_9BACI
MRLVESNSYIPEMVNEEHKKENQSIISVIAYLLDHETIDEWLERSLHLLLYGVACPFTIYLLFQFFS